MAQLLFVSEKHFVLCQNLEEKKYSELLINQQFLTFTLWEYNLKHKKEMNYIHPNSKSITQKNLFSGKIDRYYLDQKIM